MLYANIDRAISAVKDLGHELTVPNVLAAYIQCVGAHATPEDAPDSKVAARAAIVSFERAMDKYPVPAPPRGTAATRTRTKSSILAETKAPKKAPEQVLACGGLGKRMYCAEVARLRDEYRQAMWRASDYGAGYEGCTCLSCGCLLSARREQLRPLVSEGEDDVYGRDAAAAPVSARKRRTREAVTKKPRGAESAPLDPYAPSTSRAAV
ncbi:hypothetical protein C8Q79DRAFT_916053 [Trametes meyenii]|nr:hypothetical protein C8Q79DRAFT_916053 [Trametes meyenii]